MCNTSLVPSLRFSRGEGETKPGCQMCRFSENNSSTVLRSYDAQTYHKQATTQPQADINQSVMMFCVMDMHKQVYIRFLRFCGKTCMCTDSGTQAQFFPLPLIKNGACNINTLAGFLPHGVQNMQDFFRQYLSMKFDPVLISPPFQLVAACVIILL